MPMKKGTLDNRSSEQLRQHYKVEKELANRLRTASRKQRHRLYASVYDEMFRRVPHHPMLSRKSSALTTQQNVLTQIHFLKRFLKRDCIFLEVGAGDCSLSVEISNYVKKVYAIEVSEEIIRGLVPPNNLEVVLSDGVSIPAPKNSVDIAYSNQLMEHLHPDDAFDQLRNIYKCLKPGGVYVCITPNRLNGPHDISKYFDPIASGFHLKEYTVTDLYRLYRFAGFKKISTYIGVKMTYLPVPLFVTTACEALLSRLEHSVSRRVAGTLPFRLLLGIRLVGKK